MKKTPPNLKKGDTVGIIAPARKVTLSDIEYARHIFESWGLEVVFGAHLFGACNQFSGTDAERASDFQTMLDDVDVKAIFCARGGYGCVKVVDLIDFTNFVKNPKWLIGYSDITVFHAHIQNVCGIETLHATMPVNLLPMAYTSETLKTLQQVLFGKPLKFSVKHHPFNRCGIAEGILVGGNLSVLYSLMGSNSDIDTTHKILFIEDLDEYLYHIDRMMMCLKRARKLKNLNGLIVGGMSKMNDNTIPYGKTAYQIIKDIVAEYAYPVCFDFPAGHTNDNRALILGRKITMTLSEKETRIEF